MIQSGLRHNCFYPIHPIFDSLQDLLFIKIICGLLYLFIICRLKTNMAQIDQCYEAKANPKLL